MAAKKRPGAVYAVKIYYSGRLSLLGKQNGQRYVIHNRGFDRCEDKIFKKRYVAICFCRKDLSPYFCAGEMAERSNAAVLKTVEVKASGGSNPSLSATKP